MRCAIFIQWKAPKSMRRRRTSMCSRKKRKHASRFLEQARSFLHESFKSLQMQEAKHQFVLSSYRNITSKKGEAAYAAAYLVGQIYWLTLGMEKAVWDQFEEDFCGLRDTANALNDSWKQTGALHAQMKQFANKSALGLRRSGVRRGLDRSGSGTFRPHHGDPGSFADRQ